MRHPAPAAGLPPQVEIQKTKSQIPSGHCSVTQDRIKGVTVWCLAAIEPSTHLKRLSLVISGDMIHVHSTMRMEAGFCYWVRGISANSNEERCDPGSGRKCSSCTTWQSSLSPTVRSDQSSTMVPLWISNSVHWPIVCVNLNQWNQRQTWWLPNGLPCRSEPGSTPGNELLMIAPSKPRDNFKNDST